MSQRRKWPRPREALRGLVPYIPGKPVEEVKRELGLQRVIKLASNENILGPSPAAIKAIRHHLKSIHEYPEGSSHELRKAVCLKLGIAPEEVVFGAGSDEVIHLIGLAYLTPSSEVVTCSPSFVIYSTTSALFEAKLHLVPLKNFTFDLEGMLERVTRRTKVIFIANPNNPTGTIIKKREFTRFLKRLPPEVLVVLDEAYAEYVDDPEYPSGVDYIHRYPVLVLRTFSKIYGLAGLRLGYGVGNAEIVRNLERVREPFNVNRLAQVAAAEALFDEEHLRRSRELIQKERARVTALLEAMGCKVVPSQANFLYVDTGVDSTVLFHKLLRQGMIIRSGEIFGAPTFIRVTLGRPGENNMFLRAMRKALEEELNDCRFKENRGE